MTLQLLLLPVVFSFREHVWLGSQFCFCAAQESFIASITDALPMGKLPGLVPNWGYMATAMVEGGYLCELTGKSQFANAVVLSVLGHIGRVSVPAVCVLSLQRGQLPAVGVAAMSQHGPRSLWP